MTGWGWGLEKKKRETQQHREREILIAIVWPVDPRQKTRSPESSLKHRYLKSRRLGDGLVSPSLRRLFEARSTALTSTGFGGH